MNLSRDVLLKELELLPAWRLKQPIVAPVIVASKPIATTVAEVMVLEAPLEGFVDSGVEPTIEKATEKVIEITAEKVRKNVLVLVPLNAEKTTDFFASEAGILLDNMLKAVQLKRDDALEVVFNPAELNHFTAPFLLVFGAKELGVVHGMVENSAYNQVDMTVIATHHPQHLLENPLDKRVAWQDLCIYLSGLKVDAPLVK